MHNFNSTSNSVDASREKVTEAERGFSQSPTCSLAVGSPAFGRAQPGGLWPHAGKVWVAGVHFSSCQRSAGGLPLLLPGMAPLPTSCPGSPGALAAQRGEAECSW